MNVFISFVSNAHFVCIKYCIIICIYIITNIKRIYKVTNIILFICTLIVVIYDLYKMLLKDFNKRLYL